MSSLYLARIVVFLSLFMSGCSQGANDACITQGEVVVQEGKTMKMVVPDRPYAKGSIQILPKNNVVDFTKWSDANHVETRDMINRVADVWAKQNVAGYLVYGKNDPESRFNWEVVPFPESGFRYIKQFKVLWTTTFGGSCISQDERVKEAEALRRDLNSSKMGNEVVAVAVNELVKGNDAFCNQDVIDKQQVYEGKKVYVLYNYAPIGLGEEKLHFMIIPKNHRLDFTDLTQDEYVEAMQLSQKLVDYYKTKGIYTAYIFNKTGEEAGQTVPHWHQHVIFTSSKTQGFVGKLSVLKSLLLRSSPLPEEELKERVKSLRAELATPLSQ